MEELFEQPDEMVVRRPPGRPANHRSRVIVRRVLLAVLVSVFLMIVGSWWLWRSEPGVWQDTRSRLESTSDAILDQIAVRAEQRYVAFLNAANQGKQQVELALRYDDINAWIERRLAAWLAHQGMVMPQAIGQPVVAGKDGRLVVAFHMQGADINQVFSLMFELGATADGKVEVVCREIYGGRLRLPADAIEKLLVKHSRGKAMKQVEMVRPWLRGTAVDLFGHGRMKVKAVEVGDEGVKIVAGVGG